VSAGRSSSLRRWQADALNDYLNRLPRDYLAVATPGAGKTTFALMVAAELLSRRLIDRITVVAPTEHLKTQWAQAADRVGIALDPKFGTGKAVSKDFTGIVTTYAGVAANPLLHRVRVESRRTLVILDEIHHAGDALSWGEAVQEAFEPADRRLALTGTPFRSDVNPIPFVTYTPFPDGSRRSTADHTYGYAEALADGVVRPVLFMTYSGRMRWRTKAGDEVAATLGDDTLTRDVTAHAWRTALDPEGEWISSVLGAADRRLTEVRKDMPDAGGLVIASDQSDARAYAAALARVAGEKPTLVLSDDPASGKRISAFTEGTSRWMVAVRMVSEGVDVPRLAVGVYATSTATPLFFAQAVGRFVRSRRRGETASVFLPSVPRLVGFAGALELERDHVLGKPLSGDDWSPEEALINAANIDAKASDLPGGQAFEALDSEAVFDRVLFDGGEFEGGIEAGTSQEEEFLGIPGLLDAQQMTSLLSARQAAAARGPRQPKTSKSAVYEDIRALRTELGDAVRGFARARDSTAAAVHADLRRACGGPPTGSASAEELSARLAMLREWARRGA